MKPDDPTAESAAAAERARFDAELIRRMARSDREAFAQLYDRFSRPLFSTAQLILANTAEAEDIVQDVFLALWERAATFEPGRGSVFAWAVTLTRQRAIERVRLRKRRIELQSETITEDTGTPRPTEAGRHAAAELELKEQASAVRTAFTALPAEQQRAVELAFFGGLTQPELGEKLRESPGTVRARLRDGLLKLRDSLGGRAIDAAQAELAALYAFGLLEGEELARVELGLTQDTALAQLGRELREAASQLAFTAPDLAPSPELRAHLLARLETAAEWRAQRSARSVRPAAWFPWVAAAGLAIGCAWLGQLYLGSQFAASTLRDQQTVAEFKLRSTLNQLEAERLIANHQLSAVTEKTAALERQLKAPADLASLQLAILTSPLGNSSPALAVAVWDPGREVGALAVTKLPAPAADQEYQLWLLDPQSPTPVDAGIFTVDPATGDARITFKVSQPLKSVAQFAVSLGPKGGAPKPEGPMVLLSQ